MLIVSTCNSLEHYRFTWVRVKQRNLVKLRARTLGKARRFAFRSMARCKNIEMVLVTLNMGVFFKSLG